MKLEDKIDVHKWNRSTNFPYTAEQVNNMTMRRRLEIELIDTQKDKLDTSHEEIQEKLNMRVEKLKY